MSRGLDDDRADLTDRLPERRRPPKARAAETARRGRPAGAHRVLGSVTPEFTSPALAPVPTLAVEFMDITRFSCSRNTQGMLQDVEFVEDNRCLLKFVSDRVDAGLMPVSRVEAYGLVRLWITNKHTAKQ